jgi:hypothetical protein
VNKYTFVVSLWYLAALEQGGTEPESFGLNRRLMKSIFHIWESTGLGFPFRAFFWDFLPACIAAPLSPP